MSHPLLLKLQRIGSLSVAEARVLEEAVSRTRVYRADEDIVGEGDRPAECHVILTGFACRYKLLAEGKRQILSFQVPGDFGDLEGFVVGRMDHSVGTLTRCTTAVVPHKSLLDITDRHPGSRGRSGPTCSSTLLCFANGWPVSAAARPTKGWPICCAR